MSQRNRKASPELRQRLAQNVKAVREGRRYTQEELARVCRVSKNYISNIEQGRLNVTLATLELLALGLMCDEQRLLAPTRGRL